MIIKNWSKTINKNASDINIAGIVKKWECTVTDDEIKIRKVDDYDSPKRYDIIHNDEEAHTARNSLKEAEESVIDTMRHFPNGLE